jgi:hypothetical protein
MQAPVTEPWMFPRQLQQVFAQPTIVAAVLVPAA